MYYTTGFQFVYPWKRRFFRKLYRNFSSHWSCFFHFDRVQYRQNSKGDHLYAFELEHLDTIEWNGQTYLAFFPAEQEGEETPEEELGLVILKAIQENGEEILSTLDSDEEMDAVYEEFMKELFAEEDEEDS